MTEPTIALIFLSALQVEGKLTKNRQIYSGTLQTFPFSPQLLCDLKCTSIMPSEQSVYITSYANPTQKKFTHINLFTVQLQASRVHN